MCSFSNRSRQKFFKSSLPNYSPECLTQPFFPVHSPIKELGYGSAKNTGSRCTSDLWAGLILGSVNLRASYFLLIDIQFSTLMSPVQTHLTTLPPTQREATLPFILSHGHQSIIIRGPQWGATSHVNLIVQRIFYTFPNRRSPVSKESVLYGKLLWATIFRTRAIYLSCGVVLRHGRSATARIPNGRGITYKNA